MATIIGLKELRENTEAVAARVAKGESFVVVKRSKPIFELRPVGSEVAPLDQWLDQYIIDNRQLLESLADK
jgi:antitoxin (DNA-binding transcriptional repressor) of toxin-antitoxin stability system